MCNISLLEPGQEIEILWADGPRRTVVLARNAGTIVTTDGTILDASVLDESLVRLLSDHIVKIYPEEVSPQAETHARELGCDESQWQNIYHE